MSVGLCNSISNKLRLLDEMTKVPLVYVKKDKVENISTEIKVSGIKKRKLQPLTLNYLDLKEKLLKTDIYHYKQLYWKRNAV